MRKLLALTLLLNTPLAFSAPSIVELQTNVGTIAIELDYQRAPVTANNFITYVNNGFYKNTIFHRVIKGFMMQGGGFSKIDGKLKTTLAPITNESTNGLSNLTGTIAMARTSDPNSATSQFFINFVDNTFLNYRDAANPGYAVFGKVKSGMTVVRKVENLATVSDVPFTGSSDIVTIDAVYTSTSWQPTVSKTRIIKTGSGSVVSTPAGINCGTSCAISQTKGAALTILAKPASGYVFTGWTGDCRGINAKIIIDTTLGNHNCKATFTKLGPYTQ
jgi:peptidyl-prolyl cis-trans isomerase A (cyclophilin A)